MGGFGLDYACAHIFPCERKSPADPRRFRDARLTRALSAHFELA